jgi:hypothetical protein
MWLYVLLVIVLVLAAAVIAARFRARSVRGVRGIVVGGADDLWVAGKSTSKALVVIPELLAVSHDVVARFNEIRSALTVSDAWVKYNKNHFIELGADASAAGRAAWARVETAFSRLADNVNTIYRYYGELGFARAFGTPLIFDGAGRPVMRTAPLGALPPGALPPGAPPPGALTAVGEVDDLAGGEIVRLAGVAAPGDAAANAGLDAALRWLLALVLSLGVVSGAAGAAVGPAPVAGAAPPPPAWPRGHIRLPATEDLVIVDDAASLASGLRVIVAMSRADLIKKLEVGASGARALPHGFVADHAGPWSAAALCHALASVLRARVPAGAAPDWERGPTGVLYRCTGAAPDALVLSHVAYISPDTYERLRVAAARA